MTKNEIAQKKQLAALFEISLAVGQSIDAEENCRIFLTTFCDVTQAICASVWVRPEPSEPGAALPALYELCRVGEAADDPGQALITEELWFRLSGEDNLIVEHPGGGTFSFFRLLDFGVFGICHDRPMTSLLAEGRELLHRVIGKFAISLQGALAYQRLQQAERQMSANSRKQRQIIDTSLDAVILIDEYARIREWGKRACDMFGFTSEEVLGQRWYWFLRPASFWPLMDRQVEHFQRSGQFPAQQFQPFETIACDKSGREFPVEMNFSHLELNGEHVICLYFRDISERKKAESELINTHTRLESLIGNLQAGILLEDENRRILLANQYFCDMFGIPLSPSDLKGADCDAAARQASSLFTDPQGFISRLEELMQRRCLETGDILYLVDGRILERDYIPVFTEGRYQGHMWHYRDITARKRGEEELLEAKRAAEAAKLAERQFLTYMSHEIRTPMNAVIGMIHLLDEMDLHGREREYVNSLKFSADSLLRITDNILDLSKIEAGEIEFDYHQFKLQDLLQALQQSFLFKLRNKPVTLTLDVDPSIDHLVVGDYTRLNQILTNLLSNAGKFTDQGAIILRVKRLGDSAEQYQLEFSVEDTGIGIDPHELALVFEDFRQVGRDTARRFGGTGLGLPIVRQLITLQGGTIDLESEPGKGTTVRFVLPMGRSPISLSSLEPSSDSAHEPVSDVNLEQVNVLIVEDNYLNQKLMKKVLETWGCSFCLASGAGEALALSRRIPFDIILMDLHMPGQDGVETSRAIRNDEDNPNRHTPIIALTAAALTEERKRVFEAGINDFVTKPFPPSMLKNVMSRWLAGAPKKTADAARGNPSSFRQQFPFLFDFSDGDEIFIRDMVETFLREAPLAITQLREALEQDDHRQIYFIAHRLQPNLQMMGLNEPHQLVQQLEQLALQKPFSSHQAGALFRKLVQAMDDELPLMRRKSEGLLPKQNGKKART